MKLGRKIKNHPVIAGYSIPKRVEKKPTADRFLLGMVVGMSNYICPFNVYVDEPQVLHVTNWVAQRCVSRLSPANNRTKLIHCQRLLRTRTLVCLVHHPT